MGFSSRDMEERSGAEWHPWNSYGDRVSCEEVAEQARASKGPGFNIVCFPDTIDPRGPKK